MGVYEIEKFAMDTTKIFYSHPSYLSSFKVYNADKIKQRGGFLSNFSLRTGLLLTRLNKEIEKSKERMKKRN